VPDDISVVGFDDIELSQFTNPPLTTIRLSRDELGRTAFDTLYEAATGGQKRSRQLSISTTLILRESTAHARSKLGRGRRS